ncbi:MAG: recombinase family protein [gamma proteobacterium symbiont of Bathyaustriella thionipta]|nr:recombinase family protein [gamma proteobacterium symbiont of Bathyaustriella thionipta]
MQIGYARMSVDDQKLALQLAALKKAGCEKIITDPLGGARAEYPGLHQLLKLAGEGDTVVVWRLDRLGRSLKNLIELVNQLAAGGIGLISLQESINTSSENGPLIFHLFAQLAEFEQNLMRERTQAGLNAARVRGRLGGRPEALDKEQQARLYQIYSKADLTVDAICQQFRISKPTLYRYVEQIRRNKNKERSHVY